MSEEQAAEAAHQQSEKAEEGEEEEQVVEDGEQADGGDGDVEADGVEAMEEDEEQVTTNLHIAAARVAALIFTFVVWISFLLWCSGCFLHPPE